MLVGAARLLAAHHADSPLQGTVRLLFQPSEEASDDEGRSGAMRMIDDGAMRAVSAVFGLHIGANLPSGIAHVSPGPIMAGSDLFQATVRGRSAHAGGPQQGVDAIVLAAHAIIACQLGVARRIAPHEQGVLSSGTVQGGFADNVLAESVSVRGTIRYYRDDVRRVLHDALQRAFAVAETLGGGFDIATHAGYPPVVNDPAVTAIAQQSLVAALGADAVAPFAPIMYAEDFSLLAQQAPGCFIWLGASLEEPREHHHPAFDIDESALHRGAAALAACAFGALQHTGNE
jgi:amidohydrolase